MSGNQVNIACLRDLACYRNNGHDGPHMYSDQPGCYERHCGRLSEWRVTTAAGRLPFCQEHADWYIAKGPDIYPIERLHHAEKEPA